MNQSLLYYPSTLVNKTAVTLMVHGLNVKPAAMLAFVHFLNAHGSDVFLITLSGHAETGINIKNVTRHMWEEEMLAGYRIAKQAADNDVPLYFFGYSLGALLSQSMIVSSQAHASFDKQIWLAPAIGIRTRSYLLKLLILLDTKNTLPSYTPKEYRANDQLPLHIYQLLFAEEERLKKTTSNHSIPTLIVIDPKDELVSYKKIIQMIEKQQLTNCKLVVLDSKRNGNRGNYHHLILDEASMGLKNWQRTSQKMEEFLFNKQ